MSTNKLPDVPTIEVINRESAYVSALQRKALHELLDPQELIAIKEWEALRRAYNAKHNIPTQLESYAQSNHLRFAYESAPTLAGDTTDPLKRPLLKINRTNVLDPYEEQINFARELVEASHAQQSVEYFHGPHKLPKQTFFEAYAFRKIKEDADELIFESTINNLPFDTIVFNIKNKTTSFKGFFKQTTQFEIPGYIWTCIEEIVQILFKEEKQNDS